MPYNIFYLAFFAIVLGIAVALLTRFGKPAPPAEVIPEAAYQERQSHGLERSLDAAELRRVALQLFAKHGVALEREESDSEREFDLHGTSDDPLTGGRYVVRCHLAAAGEILPPERILEFRDYVRAQGLSRGVFLSSGYFARESRFLVEDAPVSLLSRGDLLRLLDT